jgi:hypothetical protein
VQGPLVLMYFVAPKGDILSPDLFASYIDDLIKILKACGVGCHVIYIFLASILFADDMALLASTLDALRQLLISVWNIALDIA